MCEEKVKRNVHIDIKQVFSTTGFWLVGIVLNMLPLFYKVLNIWLSSNDYVDGVLLFWSDIDFLGINFSVSFLLFLELFFVKSEVKWLTKLIGGILIFVTLLLLITYTIAIFNSGWSSHVPAQIMKNVNFYTLLLIVFLGIIYFVISASHIGNEVIS